MKLLIIILILIVLVFAVVKLQGGIYERFRSNASETLGRIEKKETRIDGQKNKREEHVLIFSYVVDGKTYHAEEMVEYEDLWLEASEGMDLRVYYSNGDPQKSYPAALIDRRLGIAGKFK
jgi:hypothetical protein